MALAVAAWGEDVCHYCGLGLGVLWWGMGDTCSYFSFSQHYGFCIDLDLFVEFVCEFIYCESFFFVDINVQ